MTSMDSLRRIGALLLFDPAGGKLVVGPPGDGPGFWAGAPSALRDPVEGRFYLSYRLRRPLRQGRGGVTRVAASADGRRFDTIWEATKEQFESTSIERSCLVKGDDGVWRLYVSYVDGATGKWRIDLLEAPTPDGFAPAQRREVLTADDVNAEGVKDPYVLRVGLAWYMFVPYGPRATVAPASNHEALHGGDTGNVFATGRILHATGLAVSADGIHFRWLGDAVTTGGPGSWDRSVARVSTVLHTPPVFTVFYDGRTGDGDTYEDTTGYAVTLDLRTFTKVTVDGPLLHSPHASGCLRYLDTVHIPEQRRILYYYEMARPDGAHELRMSEVELP
ncbi:MAG: hypothetical protein HY332_00345 [Chloroflexi bacterium]|nr:hypothetical protein [Chloroflexota bacterium]